MVRYNENTVIEAEAKQNLGTTVLNLNDDDDRACYYNNEGIGDMACSVSGHVG